VSPDNDVVAARQQAARLGATTEIRDVRLLSSTVDLAQLPEAIERLTYNFDTDVNVDYDDGTPSFVVRCTYKLVVMEALAEATTQNPEASQSKVLDMTFTHGALFTFTRDEGEPPPTQDELGAYAFSTGQFALYPFAREYVHDVTVRLGLPPLTIGLLQIPLPESAEAYEEVPGTVE